MTIADWNAVALPHNEWFVDAAHLDTTGGRALATFLHPLLVDACGSACVPQPVYCGLALTANGFVYVQATSFGCDAARATVVAIERGQAGTWLCSHDAHAGVLLTCVGGESRIDAAPALAGPSRSAWATSSRSRTGRSVCAAVRCKAAATTVPGRPSAGPPGAPPTSRGRCWSRSSSSRSHTAADASHSPSLHD